MGHADTTVRTSAADTAIPLEDERLYLLGGTVELDARISWYPPTPGAHVPFNAYLLRDEDDLLVEAAVPVLAPALMAQLDQVSGTDGPPRRLAVTRNEPDCVATIPCLVRDAGLETVHSPGLLNTLQFFAADEDGARERSFAHRADELQMLDFGVRCEPARPDDQVKVGGTRMLDVVAAPLKILPTVWYFDAATGTLFCSDSFADELATDPGQRVLREVADERTLVGRFRESFACKFDWLARSDLSTVIADLEALFDRYPIERLAPNRGLVIEGRDPVAAKQRALLEALHTLRQ